MLCYRELWTDLWAVAVWTGGALHTTFPGRRNEFPDEADVTPLSLHVADEMVNGTIQNSG